MPLDVETGEVTGTQCDNCQHLQQQFIQAEQDLRAAERDIRKLRRQNGSLRTQLNRQTREAPEHRVAKMLGRYWVLRCGKDERRTKLGEKRMGAVIARLRDGYHPAYIARAIDGLAEFAYVNAKTNLPYDDLELVCRNEVNLERFYTQADRGGVKTLMTPQWLREIGGRDEH